MSYNLKDKKVIKMETKYEDYPVALHVLIKIDNVTDG